MNLNYITKGKTVLLGILTIIIFFLVSGSASSIIPFILITTIAAGYIKSESLTDSAVCGLLISFVSSVITVIISLIILYASYGSTASGSMIPSLIPTIVLCMIVGIIGAVIGYYINEEIKTEDKN